MNKLNTFKRKLLYKINMYLENSKYSINNKSDIADNVKIHESTIHGNVKVDEFTTISKTTLLGEIDVESEVKITNSKLYSKKIQIGRKSNITDSFLSGTISIGTSTKVFNANIEGYFKMGNYSSLWGPNINIQTIDNAPVTIGNYCSIARNVTMQTFNHNLKKTTTYFIGKNLFDESWENERVSKGELIIQNDVWIGSNAIILSGITISNGAVIAANSLVNKDVPPFAIVAGSPAKIIGYRFEKEIIENLQKIEWWNWTPKKIKSNKKLFETELTIDLFSHIVEL